MPQAVIVDDRSYFAFDVYEGRKGSLVKILTVGPFLATEDGAREQLKKTQRANAPHLTQKPRSVVPFRYNQGLMRWSRWH